MKKSALYLTIFGLVLIGLFFSFYLSIVADFNIGTTCFPGTKCDIIEKSPYSHFFGVKLNFLGIAFFAFLSVIFLMEYYYKKIPQKTFMIFSGIGALFAIYFLYLQFFVIHSICSLCLVVNNLAIIIFLLGLFEKQITRS